MEEVIETWEEASEVKEKRGTEKIKTFPKAAVTEDITGSGSAKWL